MGAPRRTGTLLVYAGSVGLATTFLLCVYLHDVLRAIRGWHCGYDSCTVPITWTFEQTRDVLVLWFGGLRSVLQIRAGLHLQAVGFDHRSPLVTYLVIAALDCVLLWSLDLPAWTLALSAGWPLFVYALSRSSTVRPLVWEPAGLPKAHLR